MRLSKRLLIVGFSALMTVIPYFAETQMIAYNSQFLEQNNEDKIITFATSYSAWDNALNKTYGTLKMELFTNDIENLKQEQRQLTKVDKQNTWVTVVHNGSKERLTKERYNTLVNHEMP